jgi:hypothetical protein
MLNTAGSIGDKDMKTRKRHLLSYFCVASPYASGKAEGGHKNLPVAVNCCGVTSLYL